MSEKKYKRLFKISPESEDMIKATYDEYWYEIKEELEKLRSSEQRANENG